MLTDGPERPAPLRQQLLEEGIKITVGDRNKSYGDPAVNLGCAGRIKEVVHSYLGVKRDVTAGEREAIDNICTKLARIATGSTVTKDNYLDLAVYAAIAGEIALQGKGPEAGEVTKLTPQQLDDLARGRIVAVPPGTFR